MFYRLLLGAMALVLGLIAFPGCTGSDTYPGDTMKIDKSVSFYFASDGNSYKTLPEEAVNLLLEEAVWESPPHMEVESPSLEVKPTKVSWKSGNTKYSASGYQVHAKCRLNAGMGIQAGEYGVSLKLPAVGVAAAAMGTVPHIAANRSFDYSSVELKSFHVHATARGRNWAVAWKSTLLVVMIAVIAVIAVTALASEQ